MFFADTLFVSNGSTLLKADTSLNPCKIVQQFEMSNCLFCSIWIFERKSIEYLDTINCLLIYEYVAKSSMDETPMLKSLVTKSSSELIHLAIKGFSRTLLIAGLSNGLVAVLKWNTGEIDFSLDVRLTKFINRKNSYFGILDAFSSACRRYDCSYSCWSNHHLWCWLAFLLFFDNSKIRNFFPQDLIVRIWRVFPYASESLSVVRSIFCALPPVHLAVIRNSLAVAFHDESTLSHSLMVYNLEDNRENIFWILLIRLKKICVLQNDLIIYRKMIIAIRYRRSVAVRSWILLQREV